MTLNETRQKLVFRQVGTSASALIHYSYRVLPTTISKSQNRNFISIFVLTIDFPGHSAFGLKMSISRSLPAPTEGVKSRVLVEQDQISTI